MTDTNGFIGMAEFVQERLYIPSHDIFLHLGFTPPPPPLFFCPPGPCLQCTENLKHIFPEMKLSDLVPNYYDQSYLESVFFLQCVKELSAQPQERIEGQGTVAKLPRLAAVPCPALPSAPTVEPRVQPTNKFPIWKIMNYKQKQLILVVFFESECDSKKDFEEYTNICGVYVFSIRWLVTD